MSFPVKQIKCEQQKCEAANQNCTYKLSCGIDVRQAIICIKGIVIMLYHIVIFFIALADYGVYRHFQQYFSFILGGGSVLLVEETGVFREKHQPAAIKT
jgi:hypothetical protein